MNPAIERDEEKATPKLRSLYEIAKTLNSSLELKETYGRILSILSQNMGMKRGGFMLSLIHISEPTRPY